MSFKTIPLEEASREQLFHFARNVLNIEVGDGANNATIKSKIVQAKPDCTEIMVPADAAPATASPAPGAGVVAQPAAKQSGSLTTHFRDDPKVRLQIMRTTEANRAKDVQVAVQGDVFLIRRGETVSVPYRVYLALNDAIEQVARDTDEINPATGLPIKEWVEQHSYPFQVHAMPSSEEIAAWEQRVSGLQLA